MDREQILKLAKEHCDKFDNVYEEYTFGTGDILALANAIAAHEREECAKVCDIQRFMVLQPLRTYTADDVVVCKRDTANYLARAIRSRGNK